MLAGMSVELLAGDIGLGKWQAGPKGQTSFGAEIPAAEISGATVVTEDNRHRLGRTVGTAAVGALLIGPIGLLGGALFGKKNLVTFVLELTDGREILARADMRSYEQVLKYAYSR